MRDGRTRKVERIERDESFSSYLEEWRGVIVILTGGDAGMEYELDRPNVSLGRGPGVDLEFEDSAMSREHAAVEFVGHGFRVRDLGSMNGMLVNGVDVKAGDLSSGDRFQIGEHVFQLVLEQRKREPRTYVVADA